MMGGMNCDETYGKDEDDNAKDEWQQLAKNKKQEDPAAAAG